ncbi:LysR family transcriptional regulator [Halomonas sp. MCCC 1A11036]|uniref:LysR family transcriptional regulator n=1 Tax=Billgrantia zhangzhouensis TaxID=2733481 RepID=A0ABS9AKF5_9GAMM|nr:LysR family transcriptional regulator [Halomonas zhangzhouensis]MCE8022103.1 LysR family transcriptional regulator [Halomonas zhangzhouensis]
MELRQLRTFCIVAEELNLTRAAERLHMTQPPLSRKIKALEEELGSRLFIRSPQGLALTAIGQFLYEQARQLLDKVETTAMTIRRMERHLRPLLGIGFVPSVFYDRLPLLVRELRQKDEVELSLIELTTVQQVQALKTGRIDIGFGRLKIDDPDVEQEVLLDEPLLAALPEAHPLEGTTPTLEELARYPLILFPALPRPSLADMVQGLFHRRGIKTRVVQETNELQTALGLVASGLGITLVPEQVKNVQRSGIVYVHLADATLTTPVICSRRRGEAGSPRMQEISALLAR